MSAGKVILEPLKGSLTSNEDLRDLLENAPVGIHFVDRNGIILWANRAEMELLGYSAGEYVGRNIAEFHADPDAIRDILQTLANGGTLDGEVVPLRHKNGSIRWGSITSNVRWENGEFIHTRCFTRDITEKKLNEEKIAELLRKKEKQARRFDTIFETLPDFAYIFDREGRFVFANRSLLDLWGLTLEDAVGKNFFDLNYPDELAEKLQSQIEHVFTTGEGVTDITPYTNPSGKQGIYEYIFRAVPALDGMVEMVVGATRDITAHKDIEDTLRETQRVLRLAMISSRMGAWARDVITDIDYWTPELEAIFGLEPGSFAGDANGFRKYVYEEDRDKIAREIDDAIAEKREYIIEFRFHHADGSIRWMEGRGQAVYSSDGRPVKLYGIGMDISDRKNSETALRESEEDLRSLANSIPQLAWMARPDGHIFWYNQRWFEYTGTTLDEVEGWGWQSVHYDEILPKVMERWTHSLGTGEDFEMEYPIRGKDGKLRWFLTRAYPLRDSQGSITRWFGTNTNIEDLWNIRQETEAASRAKDDFLAMLSHELRAPLNVMSGWVQILRKTDYDEARVKKAIDIISRNVELQNSLIEDLLDVSRIVSGKLRLEKKAVSLPAIIQSCVEAAAAGAESKQIELKSSIDASIGTMNGDVTRLMQMVNNLLNNSLKFTPACGSVNVALEQAGPTAVLTVTDTGIGITSELLPHIFERFKQADTTSKRQYGGLGLGLAIVQHIVKLHGGTVKVHSPGLNGGSTFTVELPLFTAEKTAENVASERITIFPKSHDPKPLSGMRAVIVDDDIDALNLMSVFLESEGAAVARFGSAAPALEAIEAGLYDILISDLGMPGIDGFELIRKVRSSIAANKLPAVALTGYVSEIDRERVFEAGFQTHLPKPVELDDLRAVVLRLAVGDSA